MSIDLCCEQMRHAIESEEVPILYIPKYREFGIRILDGGTSYIVLEFCPRCGAKLPKSLRDAWFDALEQRGIDPTGSNIPPEFTDERWYQEPAYHARSLLFA